MTLTPGGEVQLYLTSVVLIVFGIVPSGNQEVPLLVEYSKLEAFAEVLALITKLLESSYALKYKVGTVLAYAKFNRNAVLHGEAPFCVVLSTEPSQLEEISFKG